MFVLKAARLRANRRGWVPAVLAAAIVLWAGLSLMVEPLDFSVYAPEASLAVESGVALSSLLGALVLSLFPTEGEGTRLRWVASGFVIMGAGAILFGILGGLLSETNYLGASSHAWLLTRSLAGTMFVAGVAFATPPRFSARFLIVALTALGVLALFVYGGELILAGGAEAAGRAVSPGSRVGWWYWLVSVLPLGLAVIAFAGSVRNRGLGGGGAWLPTAMALLAGSQLYSLLWPSAFSPMLTPVDLLRLAFAALVAVGAILELLRLASEREALLATERQRTHRMEELAALKADFTTMVAHELDSPLAAVGCFTEMLSLEDLRPEDRDRAIAGLRAEAELLRSLVQDVRSAATIEREDFEVRARPVGLRELLEGPAAFGRNLPGGRHVSATVTDASVWADPERVGQVLRNLLTNAAKFSPERSPVELRSRREGGHVRIEVADRGIGIHPDDMVRIFEKFGRGRDRMGRPVPGVGLGLYLSSRIVRAHGSELTVDSTPEEGSVFAFELEVAR